MHVQAKSGRKNLTTNETTKRKRICFRIEPKYPTHINESIIGKDDFKPIAEGFKNLSALLLEDRNFKCQEERKKNCKKCYRVCCKVQRPSVPASTLPTPYR